MKTIQIEIPDGKEAKREDGVITLVDEQTKDITERIKTFEDACEWCNAKGHGNLVTGYLRVSNLGYVADISLT